MYVIGHDNIATNQPVVGRLPGVTQASVHHGRGENGSAIFCANGYEYDDRSIVIVVNGLMDGAVALGQGLG